MVEFVAIVTEDGQQVECNRYVDLWDGSSRSLWLGQTCPIELLDAIQAGESTVEIPTVDGGKRTHRIVVTPIEWEEDSETVVPAYQIRAILDGNRDSQAGTGSPDPGSLTMCQRALPQGG